MSQRRFKQHSTFHVLLRALMPYTKENLMLSFKPSQFFSELEKTTGSSRKSLQTAMSRAVKEGLVVRDGGVPVLTKSGEARAKLIPSGDPMKDGNYFLVVYDIPNEFDYARRRFALELRALGFKQYQKSFWVSQKNYTDAIVDIMTDLKIGRFVTLGTFARTYGHSLGAETQLGTETQL